MPGIDPVVPENDRCGLTSSSKERCVLDAATFGTADLAEVALEALEALELEVVVLEQELLDLEAVDVPLDAMDISYCVALEFVGCSLSR